MFSCTTAVSSSCSVHRARPLGGSEQANAISLASAAPSKMRGLAEAGECLRVSTASNPSSTSCWRVRATVATLVSRAEAIWLSLHPAPADEVSAFNRMCALTNCPARCLPARISVLSCSRSSSLSVTMYFLTAIRFAVTTHLRGFRSHRFREPTQNQRRRALALITLSLLRLGACCRAWTGSLPRPRYEPEPKGCSSQAAQTTRTSAQLGATLRRAARGGKSLTPVKWTPQTGIMHDLRLTRRNLVSRDLAMVQDLILPNTVVPFLGEKWDAHIDGTVKTMLGRIELTEGTSYVE